MPSPAYFFPIKDNDESLTWRGVIKVPMRDCPTWALRGLFSHWHSPLLVKNDPHFCGHGAVSAPPDLGAHSISWCIASARDYARLSGAEEENVSRNWCPCQRGAPLPSSAEHVTSADWWITIPMWGAAPPLVPQLAALPPAANEELHMLQGETLSGPHLRRLNGYQTVLMLRQSW